VRSFGNDGYAKSDDTNTFLCNALKFAEKIFFKPASCMLESKVNFDNFEMQKIKILYAKSQIHHIENSIFIM
jgi:hypothetical protein